MLSKNKTINIYLLASKGRFYKFCRSTVAFYANICTISKYTKTVKRNN